MPLAHAPKPDIPALTGVRGVAALWVAAYHLLLPAGFVAGAPARVLGRGYLAVDLFFVLSGFVMALNYGALFRVPPTTETFARFLWRRAARLYPLYFCILAGRFAYTALRYRTFDLPRPWIATPLTHPAIDIPANLLLVQAWGMTSSCIGTAWSISTEWGAYFLFPAIAVLTLWRTPRAATVMAALAAGLILLTAVLDAHSGYHAGLLDAWNGATLRPMLRCLAGFMLGVALWRLRQWPPAARFAGAPACCVTVLLALAAALACDAPDLLIYPLFPALVFCLATGQSRATAPLTTAPAVWLGNISYALYLLHIFLLHPLDVTRAATRLALPLPMADIVAPATIFVALLAASHAAWRRIEMPGRRLMMALADRPQPVHSVQLTPLR
jgi:peptidoglycan/LPS O-acetylase OafA/YrhL